MRTTETFRGTTETFRRTTEKVEKFYLVLRVLVRSIFKIKLNMDSQNLCKMPLKNQNLIFIDILGNCIVFFFSIKTFRRTTELLEGLRKLLEGLRKLLGGLRNF